MRRKSKQYTRKNIKHQKRGNNRGIEEQRKYDVENK